MKKIQLTQGKFALVDDEDFEELNKYNWCVTVNGYAIRYCGTGRKDMKFICMHREVNRTKKGMLTDHINRDKLDNRKENLRTANKSQNAINTGLRSDNKSGYKGISWHGRYKKWQTSIRINNKNIYLGRFENLSDAINVRLKAELKYFNI